MKEQIRKREETIAVLEQELAALRTTADPPVSVATFAAEPIQFVTELEPLRVMSGFGQRFPEGRRRGTGQHLQAQWEADNPGHGRHTPQDAPAAEPQHIAPANEEEPQPVMEEVDASGYTLQDPLEADEPTGGHNLRKRLRSLHLFWMLHSILSLLVCWRRNYARRTGLPECWPTFEEAAVCIYRVGA